MAPLTLLPAGPAAIRPSHGQAIAVRLDHTDTWRLINVRAQPLTYRGQSGVELTVVPQPSMDSTRALHSLALIDTPTLRNGTIDVWVAGSLAPDPSPSDRAFIGVVFRSAADGSHFENIYLRPTNGRADDQLRRNHATQYESFPDYPWYRLRQETPGRYESYADIVPDEWQHMRVVVRGQRAELYVNDARQPSLVVTDLKLQGSVGDRLGLWVGPGTQGYFSRLRVTRDDTP
jgi:hypothetical protein